MPDTTTRLPDEPTPPEQTSQPRNKHIGKLGPNDVAFYLDGIEDPLILPIAQEVTLGRASPDGQVQPIVDLTPFSALERGVSRRHALIRRSEGRLTVQDLGSSNGTWLDNVRLGLGTFHPLGSGSSLKLGRLGIGIYFEDVPNSLLTEPATPKGTLLSPAYVAEQPSANSSALRLAGTDDALPISDQLADLGRDKARVVSEPQLALSSDSAGGQSVGLGAENHVKMIDSPTHGPPTGHQVPNHGDAAQPPTAPAKAHLIHYHGAVSLDPLTVFSQMGPIADEFIRYLNSLSGCQVELLLEIRADCVAGFDEITTQTIRELNDKLKFKSLSLKIE